jgi:hypothetical protein
MQLFLSVIVWEEIENIPLTIKTNLKIQINYK